MQAHMKKHHIEDEDNEYVDWTECFTDLFEKYGRPGTILRGCRQRECMTQGQLAEKSEIRQENISKMENGKRQIGMRAAKKFAAIFHTDYRVFL